MEPFSQEIPSEMSSVSKSLIWLKSNFQESLSFRALKIDEPHPFWYQINSTGLVNSLPESKKKIFIFLENINKEKWVDFCGPPRMTKFSTENLSIISNFDYWSLILVAHKNVHIK